METEEKFCTVCGKKIENPKANSKTCCNPECMRINRCRTTRAKQIEREKDPKYRALVNANANALYHRKVERIAKLEQELITYKVSVLTNKLKDTYFAGGCGGENLDKLLEVVTGVMLNIDTIDEAIASLDAEAL